MARAIAVRCFWPPDKRDAALADHGLVALRKCFDIARESRQLGRASGSVRRLRPSTPQAMFSARVALNRNVSCGTKPICRRSSFGIEIAQVHAIQLTAPS